MPHRSDTCAYAPLLFTKGDPDFWRGGHPPGRQVAFAGFDCPASLRRRISPMPLVGKALEMSRLSHPDDLRNLLCVIDGRLTASGIPVS